MKLRFVLIASFILTIFQPKWALSAHLIDVSTGNHGKFVRIVFEFQDNVLFEKPEIVGEGAFSVVFLNSSTLLPPVKTFKSDQLELVNEIEFIKQESHLTATVRLSFPNFTLKFFSLSGPNRVVVDAYQTSLLTGKSEQKELLGENDEMETSPPSVKNVSKYSASDQTMAPLAKEKSDLMEVQLADTFFSKNKTKKVPETHDENATKQIYLLIVLNVLAGVIVLLMILALAKKRRAMDLGRLFDIMAFIKKSDNRIKTIDHQLKNEFKKFDEI